MSARSSAHRADESSKSRSQVRGRPAICLDAMPMMSDLEEAAASAPHSPTLLFRARDANVPPMASHKSLPVSRDPSVQDGKPTSTAASRANSRFSSTAANHRAGATGRAQTSSAVRSLPPFASSLSGSAVNGSLSTGRPVPHPFHRDDDEASQLILMKETTNLEVPPPRAGSPGTGENVEDRRNEEVESPTVNPQREASSWSRSAPASRNASPPPRPAELATDFPSYNDSLSSTSSRRAAPKAASAPAEEVPARAVEETESTYASPTPPPRRAVVLTGQLDAPRTDANATVETRGSTMLVSAVENDAFTSLFRLNRRATEATELVPSAYKDAAENKTTTTTATTTTAAAQAVSESLVLTTAECTEVDGKSMAAAAASASATHAQAPPTATMTEDSLETRLYPLHSDDHAHTHDGDSDAHPREAAESLSPLPRPLRHSQRALAPSSDPPLSAATAQAVREAREQRAAAPSADRRDDGDEHLHVEATAAAEQHDTVSGRASATAETTKSQKDSPQAPEVTTTNSAGTASAEVMKGSTQLVTAASSAVWLVDGKAPECVDRLRAAAHGAPDAVNAPSARPPRATDPSEKPSLSSAQWIDSRDFHLSEPLAAASHTLSASPAPVAPHPDEESEQAPAKSRSESALATEEIEGPTCACDREERDVSANEPRAPGTHSSSPNATPSRLQRRSISALNTPSQRVSDEVRLLMERAQEEVRRTRASLLSTLEKERASLPHASEVVPRTSGEGACESDEASTNLHVSDTTTNTTNTQMTTVSLSPMTPSPHASSSARRRGSGENAVAAADTLEPSRALEFAAPTPAGRGSGADTLHTPHGNQRFAPSTRLSGSHGGSFSWSVSALRTELASVADAVLHRLKGYDRQNHGVLPMEVVLRVTYFVMQQRHPARMPSLAETPARGGALLPTPTPARDGPQRPSPLLRTPLATRMSGKRLTHLHGTTPTAGVKRTAAHLGEAATDSDANKENIDPADADVWWPSAARKQPRLERPMCLRETGSPEPGEGVPFPRAEAAGDAGGVEEEGDDKEVVGRPATRISPSRTLELLAASQAQRAEEAVCMDLYVTLLAAFREVFGERYAWKHLGATNATRHDAAYPLLQREPVADEESHDAKSRSRASGAESMKKRVLHDLNDVPPPLETAFPRLRQQYAVRTRSGDGSGRHVCDPRHPPPLDMLVYYQVFVDSLRELGQP